MRRDRRRVFSDPEVLELFENEPELVAVVDAIAATQPQPNNVMRRAARIGLAATLAIAAVAVATLAPWRGDGGGIEERALAAIGSGEVVHAVLTTRVPKDVLVIELTTGKRVEPTVELESWFDRRRSQVRTLMRRDGVVVDVVSSSADAVSSAGLREVRKPGAAGASASMLVAKYREALETRSARIVRRETSGGRPIAWLEFNTGAGQAQQVAVDEETGRALRVRFVGLPAASGWRQWKVVALETFPAAKSPLNRPLPVSAHPSGGAIRQSRPASLAEATRLLGGIVTLAGNEFDGLSLAAVRVQLVSRTYHDGTVDTGRGVELLYRETDDGPRQGGYLRVREAPVPEPAYSFVEGRLTMNLNPIPRPGVLDLAFDGEAWVGQLRAGRLYVTLQSRDRSNVLAAARRLASASRARP